MANIKGLIKNSFNSITAALASSFTMRKTISPSFTLNRRLPVNYLPGDVEYFANEVEKEFAPVTYARLKSAFLVVSQGLVIKCLSIIEESLMAPLVRGWYGPEFLLKPYFSSVKLNNDKYLMVYNHYGVGYGHWLADVLPRLFVEKDRLHEYKILLPENYNTFHLKTLAPFGITEKNIQYLSNSKSYKVPDITVISHVGTSCNTKDEVLQQMRSFYLDFYCGEAKVKPFRMIFISRANVNNRRIVNESEVEELVVKNGFEIFHPQDHSFEEQVKIFAECKVMMGLTGSGLTNMLFMPANGSVIEFKMENDFQNLHYFSMSSGMQLDYYYLLCKTIGEDRFTADFIIDVNKLENILKSIN